MGVRGRRRILNGRGPADASGPDVRGEGARLARANARKGWVWLGVGVVAAILFAWFLLPVADWARGFERWIGSLGVWGPLAFALIYVAGTLALAPGSVMSIAGGLAFGAWAIPLVLATATVAASLPFLIARYLARDAVAAMADKHPRFRAVDQAVDEEGWKVVLLMRLSPLIPFNLQNYAFGLTSVGFWPYVLATFFGIVPGALLYVYLGILGGAASAGSGGPLRWVLFGAGLVATAAVAVLVARKAKAKLEQAGLDREPKAT